MRPAAGNNQGSGNSCDFGGAVRAPLPIGYPGYCSLVPPPNSAGQPAVLCPNADAVLPQTAGAPIEWTVELTNGTVLTETVNWTLQQ